MSVVAEYPAPVPYGARVRFDRKVHLHVPAMVGEGRFALHWMCLDMECWNVTLDDGSTVYLFPGWGDTMEGVG